MQDRRAAGRVDQQVLGPPADGRNGFSRQSLVDLAADGPAQPTVANLHVCDLLADDPGLDAPAAGFDLG